MGKQWSLSVIAFFCCIWVCGQSCAEITSHPLCANVEEVPENHLDGGSFQYGCFEASSSFSYLLTTGGLGGTLNLTIRRDECDYIQVDPVTGTAQVALDSIFISIIQIDGEQGACDSLNYINQLGCYLLLGEETTLPFSSLPSHSNFLVVVGSNHNSTLFGDCSVQLSVSGSPLEISTTKTPSFIFAGQESQITVSGQTPDATVSWTPAEFVGNANAEVTNAFPTETTVFNVNSQIGLCDVSGTVQVLVGNAIDFFNAISPNGDNVNDTWGILGIQKFPRAEVNVYDRWGQNVFRSIGYATPWDGTNRGKKLPTGSYYYVIELNSPVVYIEPYTGFISVMH